jgi:hypothetical protein
VSDQQGWVTPRGVVARSHGQAAGSGAAADGLCRVKRQTQLLNGVGNVLTCIAVVAACFAVAGSGSSDGTMTEQRSCSIAQLTRT